MFLFCFYIFGILTKILQYISLDFEENILFFLSVSESKLLPRHRCLHKYFQGVSIYVSTLSWTAIAIDRLRAMTSATTINMKTSTRSTIIKIVIINIISVLAILPYCAHMEVKYIITTLTIKICQMSDLSRDSNGIEDLGT